MPKIIFFVPGVHNIIELLLRRTLLRLVILLSNVVNFTNEMAALLRYMFGNSFHFFIFKKRFGASNMDTDQLFGLQT